VEEGEREPATHRGFIVSVGFLAVKGWWLCSQEESSET